MDLAKHLQASRKALDGNGVSSLYEYFGIVLTDNEDGTKSVPAPLGNMSNLLIPLFGSNHSRNKGGDNYGAYPEEIVLAKKLLLQHLNKIFELPEADQSAALANILNRFVVRQNNYRCFHGAQEFANITNALNSPEIKADKHLCFNNSARIQRGLKAYERDNKTRCLIRQNDSTSVYNSPTAEDFENGYLQAAIYDLTQLASKEIPEKQREAFFAHFISFIGDCAHNLEQTGHWPRLEANSGDLKNYNTQAKMDISSPIKPSGFFRNEDIKNAVHALIAYQLDGCYDDDPKRYELMKNLGRMVEKKRQDSQTSEEFLTFFLSAVQDAFEFGKNYKPHYTIAAHEAVGEIINIVAHQKAMPTAAGSTEERENAIAAAIMPALSRVRLLAKPERDEALSQLIDGLIRIGKQVKIDITLPSVNVASTSRSLEK